MALASAKCAIRHWREGGSAAAPAYQHAFARQMRRPIAVAELVSGLARHPVSTTLALSLIARFPGALRLIRSEEHTSELQSLMRISYAVFCLKKKKQNHTNKSQYAHIY